MAGLWEAWLLMLMDEKGDCGPLVVDGDEADVVGVSGKGQQEYGFYRTLRSGQGPVGVSRGVRS